MEEYLRSLLESSDEENEVVVEGNSTAESDDVVVTGPIEVISDGSDNQNDVGGDTEADRGITYYSNGSEYIEPISGSNHESNNNLVHEENDFSSEPVRQESSKDNIRYEYGDENDEGSVRNTYRQREGQRPVNRRYSVDRNNRKNKKKNDVNFFASLLKVACFALIFGIAFAVTYGFASNFGKKPVQERVETKVAENIDSEEKQSTTSVNNGTASALDVSGIVDEVMPSVVSITGTYQTSNIFGFNTGQAQGAGSGFIIAKNNDKMYIATNNHVVANATALSVGFIDNSTVDAQIVGKDTSSDLAVISVDLKDIKEDTLGKIKVATLGSSENMKVGQPVIAIGNALGYGQSVTTGVLSAKDREVSFTDGTMVLLQTDAAINPGNSGGVLINLQGEVIGINNAKMADTTVEGMGYAIPITTANSILNDLMNSGDISKEDSAYLGVIGKTINSSYSQALGIPQGVYISQVIEGSPAEKAGISAGDVITAIDDSSVTSMEGLKERISLKKAGTTVKLTLKRASQSGEYKDETIAVELGKASDFNVETDNRNGNNDNGFNQPDGNNGNQGGEEIPGWNYGTQGDDSEMDPFEYFFNYY